MVFYQTDQIALGPQDESDYNYLLSPFCS